jgi:hypothetical protein
VKHSVSKDWAAADPRCNLAFEEWWAGQLKNPKAILNCLMRYLSDKCMIEHEENSRGPWETPTPSQVKELLREAWFISALETSKVYNGVPSPP